MDKNTTHQVRAIAAISIARREVMAAWDASGDADADYTYEFVAQELDGLAAYVQDPHRHAWDSLGFTG